MEPSIPFTDLRNDFPQPYPQACQKMAFADNILDCIGRLIARRLEKPSSYKSFMRSDPEALRQTLRPGDVLLVEGDQKISAAIKYLTQSTWSHAALYVGDVLGQSVDVSEACYLIEANVGEGVVAAPLSKYASYNTRICRPVGLSADEVHQVVRFAVGRIGDKYDMRNIIDLARYLFPMPPVPSRWRRRMIALGAGEPTRKICSTLIAQAFQTVGYPILPQIESAPGHLRDENSFSAREIMHIRDHCLFTPSDFDLSPYFQVVKPMLENNFDYHKLQRANNNDRIPELENEGASNPAHPCAPTTAANV